ncbi:MAG TPA: RsmE family RNA methyltransferase [bacterium]|nr:RsmE family RNA methyltransferase [bacterium]
MSENTAVIYGKRVSHLNEILKVQTASKIKAGIYDGRKGVAEIEKINDLEAVLKLDLEEYPEPKIPLTVIIGLSRPKVMSRLISDLTSYGVEKIEIIQTYFGDKGYWDNDIFSPDGLQEAIVKGLEQSMDTVPPEISIVKRFGPYSNDILPQYNQEITACFIATPFADVHIKSIEKKERSVIAIGPERGFTKYEVNQFIKAGFQPVSLGGRIIRTEAAVHIAVAGFI